MANEAAFLHRAFMASSFSAAVDMMSTNVSIGERYNGVAAMRVQVTLSSAAVVSVITKNASATVLASSQLQSGSSLTANAAYAWVYLINANHLYNLQLSAAVTTVTGEVSVVEAPLF